MKNLLFIALLAGTSVTAKGQNFINNTSVNLEVGVACYDPSTCTVTVAAGSFTSAPGMQTVSLPNSPCTAPDETAYVVRCSSTTTEIYFTFGTVCTSGVVDGMHPAGPGGGAIPIPPCGVILPMVQGVGSDLVAN